MDNAAPQVAPPRAAAPVSDTPPTTLRAGSAFGAVTFDGVDLDAVQRQAATNIASMLFNDV